MDLLAEKKIKLFRCGVGCVGFLEMLNLKLAQGKKDFRLFLSRVRIALLFGVCPERL